jgi:hypothetical protein
MSRTIYWEIWISWKSGCETSYFPYRRKWNFICTAWVWRNMTPLRKVCLQGKCDRNIWNLKSLYRSHWPRGLRRRSAAARLLRMWVRNPPGAWLFVVSVTCCQVEGLCDGLITRPEESYRLRSSRCVWSTNPKNEETLAHWGMSRQKERKSLNIQFYQHKERNSATSFSASNVMVTQKKEPLAAVYVWLSVG